MNPDIVGPVAMLMPTCWAPLLALVVAFQPEVVAAPGGSRCSSAAEVAGARPACLSAKASHGPPTWWPSTTVATWCG
ncbi:MAG TPA: hypothetical protein VGL59_16885 [Polyangia bacterium]